MKQISLVKQMIKSKLTSTPYKLNFVTTAACNSKCVTCNIWKVYLDNPAVIKNELTLDELKKIFDALPDTISWLSLTGGEPFLRTDLADIMIEAQKRIKNLKLLSMPNNGLIPERVIDCLKKVLADKKHVPIIMTFSIDGPEEIHDVVRGVKGGYRRTMDAYTQVKELTKDDPHFLVAIETTISSRNVKYLYDWFEILFKQDHKVSVTVAHEAYLYKNTSNQLGITPRDHIAEIKRITKLFNKHLSVMNPKQLMERLYMKKIPVFLEKNDNKQIVPCQSLSASIAMNSFGELTPCLMWDKKLANIREFDYDLKKVLALQSTKDVRQMIKLEKCPNCWTPCEAYQSIFWALANGKYLKA
ncbi:radical SAM protein [Candidatus Woesearchaeota archaeon]|nr:radical SAM protein [Candidatus Woesearchaeota archaeon]